MNPYFWFFALCALFITPVTVHAVVLVEGDVHWRLKIQAAGITLKQWEKQEKRSGEEHGKQRSILPVLMREGSLGRLIRAFRCERLDVHLRLSFEDAAATAMIFALIRTLLETLRRCRALPRYLTGGVETDFHAQGTKARMQGIYSARLGIIALACARLAIAAAKARARLATEEEQYAAASH